MHTHQINIAHGRENVHDIRRELFAFSEILDVYPTGRPDSLIIVHAGRPRLGEWLRALRAVGYLPPARRHPETLSTTLCSIVPFRVQATEIDRARRPHAA